MCTSLTTNCIPIGQTFKFAIFFWWFGSCCDFLFKRMELIIGTRCVWFIWLVCGLGNICRHFFPSMFNNDNFEKIYPKTFNSTISIQLRFITWLLTRTLWSVYCARPAYLSVMILSLLNRSSALSMIVYYQLFSCAFCNSRQYSSILSVAENSSQSEPSFITLL